MNFLCICLAPAIDATVRLNAWPTDGCIIKNAADTFAPGGKAVNVARWLAVRNRAAASARTAVDAQHEPPHRRIACGGLLGEDNAAMFEKELKKYGIEDRFVRVPGSTRVNEMFVTPTGSFKVNRAAFPGSSGDGALAVATRADVVILSGSLPKDWPVDTYRHLAEAAKQAGAKVVLDASGKALVEGVKAHPDVIKPNAEECEALVGFVPKTPDEFKRATAALKAFCDYPIISDGGAGCWFDGEFVAAPKVEVLDTTAAGDTLLAEWCWQTFGCSGPSENRTIEQSEQSNNSLRWAVAAGSAACTMPGGEPPPVELVSRLASHVSRPPVSANNDLS